LAAYTTPEGGCQSRPGRVHGRNRPVLVIADRSGSGHHGRVASTKAPRRVVILAFPGVQPLDVVGPAEVFAGADALAGGGAYTVEVVAKEREPIFGRSSGYGIAPKGTTAGCRGPIDTLMVAGGIGVAKAEDDPALIRWIRSAARRSRRVTSV